MGLRVISYSLFGSDPFYWNPIPAIVRAHHTIFPGWQLRIYHDTGFAGNYAAQLRELSRIGLVKLVDCGLPEALCLSMLWRMQSCWDPEVDYVICRDIDSMPMIRDRRIVEEFISTGAVVHTVSDHPHHNGIWNMFGGMVGFRAQDFVKLMSVSSFSEFIALGNYSQQQWCTRPQDMYFLEERVWPKVAKVTCEHRLSGPPYSPDLVMKSFNRVPDLVLGDVSQTVVENADMFAPHIGTKFFDIAGAIRFFNQYGDQEIMARIATAEQSK